MKEVLAQFQIDALLNDILGGRVEINSNTELTQKKVKEYNFKIPKKFTKEQLRTVLGVYDIYSRHLSSYLTGTLRTFCQVEVVSIEETKYYEYSNALPESVLLGVLELNPFEGNVLMEFSKDLAFTIIDKLLGGSGNCGVVDREYTDIELVLMERLYKNIITYLKDAWSNVADIEPVFRKFETNNGASNVMHLDEIVVIIVLNVKVKDITGKVTVCLPFMWLESINEKLYTKNRMAERPRNDVDIELTKQSILSQIQRSEIDVTAILGNACIQMKDLLGMEVGDVIKLNQKLGDHVKINIGNKSWFYAQLGIFNNNKAVKILSSVE